MAINPDPKLIEFARGLLELSKRTGYVPASCGCCPPAIEKSGARHALEGEGLVQAICAESGGFAFPVMSNEDATAQHTKDMRATRQLLGLEP